MVAGCLTKWLANLVGGCVGHLVRGDKKERARGLGSSFSVFFPKKIQNTEWKGRVKSP